MRSQWKFVVDRVRRLSETLTIGLVTAGMFFGCTYDPPPEVELKLPSGGLYELGSPLLLTFSESVVAGSLAVRVWPDGEGDRTIENELMPGLQPELDTCTAQAFSDSPSANCGQNTFMLSEDGLSATLQLVDEAFGKARVPWELEVLEGLSDGSRKTGSNHRFSFQFAPPTETTGKTIEFQSGLYLFHAPIEDPLPTQLTMFADLVALPDGKMLWTSGKALHKEDEGAAKNTKNLDELYVDPSDRGFCVHTTGVLTEDDTSGRFMTTEPIDVSLTISGVNITLADVKMNGTVLRENGLDTIEGTISFSGLTIQVGDTDPFPYPEGNAAFTMFQVPDDKPFPGAPRACGDLRGVVTTQCDPPDDYPPAGFCEAAEAGSTDGGDGTDGTDATE